MAQAHRDKTLDRAKGMAIFAVVLFHITRGFVSAGQLRETPALHFADTFVYGIHVQTFLLIAGFLAYPRAHDALYQLRRQTTLYYAYLLWSLVSWGLAVSLGQDVNHPLGLQDLVRIPFVAIQHFWFLLALMAGTMLLYPLRSGPSLLAGAALCLLLSYPPFLLAVGAAQPGIVTLYLQAILFILIGGWLAQRVAQSGDRIVVSAPIALACTAALALVAWRATTTGEALHGPVHAPFMLGGCYALYVAAHYAGRFKRLAAALDLLGRHSFAIYILHVIAGAGVRIILSKLVPELNVAAAMLLSLGAALGIPIAVELMARRLRLAVLLGLDPLPIWRNPRPVAA